MLIGYTRISTTDQNLKDAQCEAAWYLYQNNEEQVRHEALAAQGVQSFRVGTFSETMKEPALPEPVENLLAGYVSAYGHAKITVKRDLEPNTGA